MIELRSSVRPVEDCEALEVELDADFEDMESLFDELDDLFVELDEVVSFAPLVTVATREALERLFNEFDSLLVV